MGLALPPMQSLPSLVFVVTYINLIQNYFLLSSFEGLNNVFCTPPLAALIWSWIVFVLCFGTVLCF